MFKELSARGFLFKGVQVECKAALKYALLRQWHTMNTVFSFNSSCLVKKDVLLPDFPILYALFLEISFLCKVLGRKVYSFPFLSS